MKWDAFISYSHATDGLLAPALQNALQRLARPWYRVRALHIFRDKTGLGIDSKLWGSIQKSLDESEFFILLASPEASASKWVNKEIEYWKQTKSVNRILPVVTDGTWHWDSAAKDFDRDLSTAVPPALTGVFTEEPFYLDLAWAKQSTDLDTKKPRFLDAVASLAAPIHGKGKDDLLSEDVLRHRQVKLLTTATVTVLSLLTGFLIFATYIAKKNEQEAIKQTAKAVSQRLIAQSGHFTNPPDLNFFLAAKAHQIRSALESENAIIAAIQRLRKLEIGFIYRAPEVPSYSILILPDRELVIWGDDADRLVFYDRKLRSIIKTTSLKPYGSATRLFRSREKNKLVVVTFGAILELDMDTSQLKMIAITPDAVVDATYDNQFNRLVTLHLEGPGSLWDLDKGNVISHFGDQQNHPNTASFSQQGSLLALGNSDGSLELRGGQLLELTHWRQQDVRADSVAISPDAKLLASGGKDGRVRVWDVVSGESLTDHQLHVGNIWDIGFTESYPGYQYIGSAGADNNIGWLELPAFRPIPATKIHQSRINDIDFASDGTYATAGNSGQVVDFDPWDQQILPAQQIEINDVPSLIALSQNGTKLVVAEYGTGSVNIYDIVTRLPTGIKLEIKKQISAGSYNAEVDLIGLGSADGSIILWQPGGQPEFWSSKLLDGEVRELQFSPSGERLVAIDHTGKVLLGSIEGISISTANIIHERGSLGLAFNKTGTAIAFGHREGGIVMIDLDDVDTETVIAKKTSPKTLAFHPERALLLAGDLYGYLHFINLDTNVMDNKPVSGHSGHIVGMGLIANDGVITAGYDGKFRYWDIDLQRPVGLAIDAHTKPISVFSYSRNTSLVISGGVGRRLLIRNLNIKNFIREGCALIGNRELTPDEERQFQIEEWNQPICSLSSV